MSKRDWLRLIIHLPWGMMAAVLLIPHPAIGITALAGEFGYEYLNDKAKGDQSFKDCLGITWGFLIGSLSLWALGFL